MFAAALALAPSLNVVAVPGHGNEELPYFVRRVLGNDSVRQVRIVGCSRRMKRKLEKYLSADATFRERVAYVNE